MKSEVKVESKYEPSYEELLKLMYIRKDGKVELNFLNVSGDWVCLTITADDWNRIISSAAAWSAK